MNSIFIRRSIRNFKEGTISKKQIENIIRAGMQAPSGCNQQPWEFLIITNKKDIETCSTFTSGAASAKNAAVIIMLLANTTTQKTGIDWFPQDLGACMQNMLLQTVEESLGAFWIGIYPSKEKMSPAQKYFSLPEHIQPFSMLALGIPNGENKFIDRYKEEKIHWEKY